MNSIADAIPGTSDENLRQISTFLQNSRYPGWTWPDKHGCADNPLSLRLKGHEYLGLPQGEDLPDREFLGDVGFGLGVVSCDLGLFARPQRLSESPAEVIGQTNDIWYEGNPRLPTGYRVPSWDVTDNEWADLVLSATNRKLRNLILPSSGRRPDRAHIHALAVLLDDPEEEVRVKICGLYAYAYSLPEHKPHPEDILRNGVRVTTYPDLVQQVAFWRDYIASH